MSGFSVDWLTLREPHDQRARNQDVLEAVARFFCCHSQIRIADIACGTGSTMRALGPRLPSQQTWNLIDHDSVLLANAAASCGNSRVAVTTTMLDLNGGIDAALDGPVDLITTSALLDLVSDDWLKRLADTIATRSIPFYAALSYDGRMSFSPSDKFDAAITSAFNTHQCTDKGFGPALGPTAAAQAIACFEAVGYSVMHGASDWQIESAEHQMQAELLAGWASAARDVGILAVSDVADWLKRRRALVAAGLSSLQVGHVDFFAVPMTTR